MPDPKKPVVADDPIEEQVEEAIGGEDEEAVNVEAVAEAAEETGEETTEAGEIKTTEAEEVAAFRTLFGAGELDVQEERPAIKPAQQVETQGIVSSFQDVSESEFDEILKDPKAYNKRRKEDFNAAKLEGIQQAVSYMNQVMENRLQVERIVNEFYDTYRDLRAHKPLVKAAIEQVRAEKPKASLPEVLVAAARATRAYVTNKNGATAKKGTTQQLSNKTVRQPVKKVAPDSREARLKAFVQRHVGAK